MTHVDTSAPPAPSHAARRIAPGVIYFFGALGALLWGYDNGVLAGALLFIEPQFSMTPTEIGLVGSFLSIGSALGAVTSGLLANPLGRKRMIFIASLVFAVGIALATFASGVPMLMLARLVLGLGIGLVAVSIPVYLAEISPAGARGRIGSLTQLMIASGILLGYVGNLALSPFGAWRLMFAVMIVPTIVLAVGVWVLPESPRWLLRKGRLDEARAQLAQQVDAEELERTVSEMQESLATRRLPLRHAFATGLGKIIVLAIALEMLTQLLGINTIVYYAPSILKSMGFSDHAALVNTIGFGVVSVVFTVIAGRVIDRLGRRFLMGFGALIMAAAMITMATLSATIGFTVGISGIIGIIALCVFKATYSLSWGTATRIVVSELLPTRIRGSMQGIAQIFNYAATFVLSLTFPILLATGSGLAFAIFGGMGVLASIVVFLFLPETKGKTLEEIEAQVTARKAGH